MFDGRIAPLCCNYLTECLFVLRSSKFIQICQHKKGPCYFTQKNAPKTKDIVVQEEYSLVARLLACDPLGLLELIFYALWVLKPCDSCRTIVFMIMIVASYMDHGHCQEISLRNRRTRRFQESLFFEIFLPGTQVIHSKPANI